MRHAELVLAVGEFDAVLDIRHFLAEGGEPGDAALGALHEFGELRPEQVEPCIGEAAEIGMS